MPNPFSGIITAAFKATYDNAIDALLEDDALTVPCRMEFGITKNTECPNCLTDPINRTSANKYRPGGPVSFVTGTICPTCNGLGFLPIESSETFNMAVIWNDNRSKFIKLGLNLDNSKTYAQSICHAEHYPAIVQSRRACLNTDLAGYGLQTYLREGDPTPYKMGNKTYIVTMWSRVN